MYAFHVLIVIQHNVYWIENARLAQKKTYPSLKTEVSHHTIAEVAFCINVFEPTCAYARWALMHCFPSVT